jgi:hypothetical protein
MEQDPIWRGIILAAAVACAVYCFTDVAQPSKKHPKSTSTECKAVDPAPDAPGVGGKADDGSEAMPNCESDDGSEATPSSEFNEWLEVSEVDAHIKN